jgi:methylmalonyl-CoA mutase
MSKQTQNPGAGFTNPALSDWRALADKAIAGADFETALVRRTSSGIARGPLRTIKDDPANAGTPGAYPFVRGISAQLDSNRPWHITQSYTMQSPKAANTAILEDLAGGTSALLLYLDPTGQNGIAVQSLDDLRCVLRGVDLGIVPVLLQARPLNAAYAAMLIQCLQEHDLGTLQGGLGFSPVGQTIRHGFDLADLPEKLRRTASYAQWCADHAPGIATVVITSSLIHEAGGSEALALAFAAAGGLSYLKAMVEDGLDINTAANAIMFSLSLDADIPLGIAKLRAARRIWARITRACGATQEASAMRIHVGTSRRMMSRRAPYTNILRTSTAAFAAMAGGAQYISVEPYDLMLGTQSPKARRLARNVQIILQEEMHAGAVMDPAGGSYAIEKLTDDLAQAAWAAFQDIEHCGGLVRAASSGWLGKTLSAQRDARLKAIRCAEQKLVGVTAFVDKEETLNDIAPLTPVIAKPDAIPFAKTFTLESFFEAAKAGAVLTPEKAGKPNPDFAPTNLCAPFEDEAKGQAS